MVTPGFCADMGFLKGEKPELRKVGVVVIAVVTGAGVVVVAVSN